MSGLAVPQSWFVRAAKTRAAVEAAIQAGQVPEFPSLWTDIELRDALIAIAGQKCWYCETDVHGSNPDVDHFRPKRGRSARDGHQGYWWLAYEPSNYRIACSYCNSGGGRFDDGSHPAAKVAQFPLLVEQDRATGPDNLHREMPILLDPACQGDHFLIDFSADGRTRRRSTIVLTVWEKAAALCRVTVSRDAYRLDRQLLIEGRMTVMSDVADLADLLLAVGSDTAAACDFVERKLRVLIDPRTEYSKAALSALRARQDAPLVGEKFAAELAADMPEIVTAEAGQPPIIDIGYLINTKMIEAGVELSGRGLAGAVAATLLADGRVQFGARVYPTPDSAAAIASGTAGIDGWTFWSTTHEGRRVTLSDLRAIAALR